MKFIILFLFILSHANANNNACVVQAIENFKPGALSAMRTTNDSSLATASSSLRDKYFKRVDAARGAGKKADPSDLAALTSLEKHQANVEEALAQRARVEATLSKATPGSDEFKAAEAALARADEKLRGLANKQDDLSLQLNNGERFDTAVFDRELQSPTQVPAPTPQASSPPKTTSPKAAGKTYPHAERLDAIEKKRSEFDALQDRVEDLSEADFTRHETLYKQLMSDQQAIVKAAGDATRTLSDGAPIKRVSALEALSKERVLTQAELQELRDLTLLSP